MIFYSLSFSYNFDGVVLKGAIDNTLERRQTAVIGIPIVFREEFQNDEMKQVQWAAFLRKTRIDKVKKEFSDIMKRITDFLEPVVISIRDKTAMKKWWNNEKGSWEELENIK